MSNIYKFDISLLDILMCPISKGKLRYDNLTNELISDEARVAFPIVEGIPVLVLAQARSLGN